MRPNLHKPERATPGDLATCREMIRTGSRSFFAASLLLPEHVRNGAYALYAFCRFSDDSVDVDHGGEAAVARLASRLDAIYAGTPADGAVDRALADAVELYAIPRAPFDALLEGLAWDAAGRGCETLADLNAYAARVAGAVGAMMAALMGVREPHMVARATDLGVAMQMTNIARDVGEDARAGRLYLPRAWMREAGIDPDRWLERPTHTPELAEILSRLLQRADELYRRADAGIAALPAPFRPAIYAARLLYAEIGAGVVRAGFDSMTRRSVVPPGRKLRLVSRALRRAWRTAPDAALHDPALPQTQFLVDAIAEAAAAPLTASRGVAHDVKWVIDLFAALDERPRRLA
ncbi:MAG: phytoene/squalene synthase family protein [Hyphomonadaceae bacterium]|nr:phytoene/squalene synthase family protein [Hyphomonadaceae bacterium]